MREKAKQTLKNMVTVFNHIVKYQNSGTKIFNKDETKDTILYHYDREAVISSVYADSGEINVFYNDKNHIREIMDHNGEFSLFVIYNEDNTIKHAFIANCFSKNVMNIIGDDVRIVQIDPLARIFQIIDKNNLIYVYRDSPDGLKLIIE